MVIALVLLKVGILSYLEREEVFVEEVVFRLLNLLEQMEIVVVVVVVIAVIAEVVVEVVEVDQIA